jgi:NADH-quinone oxidoreductase subunit C
MTQKLDTLQAALQTVVAAVADGALARLVRERGELTLHVPAEHYLRVAQTLRDHELLKFEQLIDLCGVDYSEYKDQAWDGQRYVQQLALALKGFCG